MIFYFGYFMAHVCYNQFIHILCATKNLEHSISEESRDPLYAYIGGIIKNSSGQCLAISGTANHIHLLINLPTSSSIAAFLCQVKACSSKWYSQQEKRPLSFAWGAGYLAFTVSPGAISSTKKYFSMDSKRHIAISVEDEILHFLKFQEVTFNPQYITTTTYTNLIYHLVWSVKNWADKYGWKKCYPLLNQG